MKRTIIAKPTSFPAGPREAKRLGGKFDTETKTWRIPAEGVDLGSLRARGLRMIDLRVSRTPEEEKAAAEEAWRRLEGRW